MRAGAAVLLAIFSTLATGCVAAALPLVAGVATFHGTADRDGKPPKGEGAATAPSAVRVSAPIAEKTPSETVVRVTSLAAMPPPVFATAGSSSPIFALQSYVIGLTERPANGAGRRLSALLAKSGDLTSARAECRAASGAVFIDLDPGRGTFDPLSPGLPNDDLAAALASIRAQGISVVWFSRLGENFDAAVRGALAASKLDPDRRDQVVLMRTIEERKQTRREALADFLCPLALVGDERADFDELYLYLRNKDAAVSLESLVGDGWFLVSPFQSHLTGAQP